MTTRITKWGNSLAVRIPKAVAQAARFRKGDRLALTVTTPGAIEIRSVKQKPTLAQLA